MKWLSSLLLLLLLPVYSFTQCKLCKQLRKQIYEYERIVFLTHDTMTVDEAIAFFDRYDREIIKNENIRDGKWVVYIDSSITPAIFFELKNGKLNGDYVRFYGNGSIDIYRFFNDDKYINYIAAWDTNAKLVGIDDYLQTYKDRRLILNKRQRIESVINFYGENSGTREYKRPRCLPIKYWHLRRGCKWKW